MNARIRLAAIALATALATALGAALPAQAAKLYKWVDAEGNVTYSQQRPPDQEAETIRLRRSMRILKSASRIQDKDANGEPFYLDEAGVKAKLAQTQEQIDNNCK
jgi:hypothetical protein